MEIVLWTIGATIIVSVLSFIGIIALLIKDKLLEKILLLLVGFSAGSLLGGALLHLIPEAIEESTTFNIVIWVLAGFTIFFIIERVFHWHHDHKCKGKCRKLKDKTTLSYMNLIGDGFHNFIDGLVIAAAFAVNINLGVVTTIAVIAHELPQEISDFGVLVYGGFTKKKALIFNFLSAIIAIIGAIVGILLFRSIEGIIPSLLAITAGGFIYIAASDLIPELNRESKIAKSLLAFLFFLLGIGFMFVFKIIFEG